MERRWLQPGWNHRRNGTCRPLCAHVAADDDDALTAGSILGTISIPPVLTTSRRAHDIFSSAPCSTDADREETFSGRAGRRYGGRPRARATARACARTPPAWCASSPVWPRTRTRGGRTRAISRASWNGSRNHSQRPGDREDDVIGDDRERRGSPSVAIAGAVAIAALSLWNLGALPANRSANVPSAFWTIGCAVSARRFFGGRAAAIALGSPSLPRRDGSVRRIRRRARTHGRAAETRAGRSG